jgi:tetratricopeptide (TPR) repeat protein
MRLALLLLLIPARCPDAWAQATSPPSQAPPSQSSAPALESAERQRTPREMAELRADVMMARKEYADAITAYQQILRREPKNAVLLNKIGIAYSQLSQLDNAKRYYDRAIKADKNFAEAHNNVGTVWYQRRNFGRAIKSYRRAIEIYERGTAPRPGYGAVQSNLGYALFATKKFEEAIACFQIALAHDPEVLDRRSTGGTLIQDRSVEERAFFYYFVAKNFALRGMAERCAHYLKRAADEGYKGISEVEKDPAFSQVIQDPLVQEVLKAHAAAKAEKSD